VKRVIGAAVRIQRWWRERHPKKKYYSKREYS
jgi:hypothetical protein